MHSHNILVLLLEFIHSVIAMIIVVHPYTHFVDIHIIQAHTCHSMLTFLCSQVRSTRVDLYAAQLSRVLQEKTT